MGNSCAGRDFPARLSPKLLNNSNRTKEENPEEQGHNGYYRTDYHQLSGQLTVSSHVLGHRIGGRCYRRTVNSNQKEQFQSPQAQSMADDQHNGRQDSKLKAEGRNQIFQVVSNLIKVQRSAQKK